jgi:hypothetical protein
MSSIVLFSDHYNYYLHAGRTSMRKSFDGLCGIIQGELGREMNVKDVFIFLNKQLSSTILVAYLPVTGLTLTGTQILKVTGTASSFTRCSYQ